MPALVVVLLAVVVASCSPEEYRAEQVRRTAAVAEQKTQCESSGGQWLSYSAGKFGGTHCVK